VFEFCRRPKVRGSKLPGERITARNLDLRAF